MLSILLPNLKIMRVPVLQRVSVPVLLNLLVLVLFFGAAPVLADQETGRPLRWQSRFEVAPPLSDWPGVVMQYGAENFHLVKDTLGKFATVMRVDYPRGSWSPAQTKKAGLAVGGLGFLARVVGDAPAETLHLRYYVRFPADFVFVKGGKLPGLYGGEGNRGGEQPNGSDGFSVRLMWRAQGAGEVYAYLPGQPGDYGVSLGRGSWRFTPDHWTLLELELRLNTPPRHDGSLRLWVDEKLVVEQGGLRFRDVGALRIDGLMFSTFFGGNDASWATPGTTSVYFANFAVSDSYIGP